MWEHVPFDSEISDVAMVSAVIPVSSLTSFKCLFPLVDFKIYSLPSFLCLQIQFSCGTYEIRVTFTNFMSPWDSAHCCRQ